MWDKERRSAFRRVFGRCRQKRGGGSKTTQSRTIPNQTPEEKSLQDALMKYAEKGLKMTDEDGGILDQARAAIGKMYMPDWSQASSDTERNLIDAINTYGSAVKDNYNRFATRSDAVLGEYNNRIDGVDSKYEDLTNGVLPSKFGEARQQALNTDLSKTIGLS